MYRLNLLCFLFVIGCSVPSLCGKGKYSKEANAKYSEYDPNYSYETKVRFVDEPNVNIRNIDKPYRMAKLNLLWTKAQHRLTEPKLKSLFSELKMHDKEEIMLKKLKAEGQDKDGKMEADMRRRLIGIMSTYGLLEHFDEVQSPEKYKDHEPFSGPVDYQHKGVFRDKKLNKLWEKAESSGFTAEELQVLKEEFNHHQEKVDQYYSILYDVQQGDPEKSKNSVDNKMEYLNEIDQAEENDPITKDYLSTVNKLRDKHRELRDDYDRLYRMAVSGPNSREFVEPKVQGLWKIAIKSNFSPDELESIRVELAHYEKRLLKLRRMHVDAAVEGEYRRKAGKEFDKISTADLTEDMIKKQTRKVAKIHLDLEARIMAKHSEL